MQKIHRQWTTYKHRGITLAETLMIFAVGSGLGLAGGL